MNRLIYEHRKKIWEESLMLPNTNDLFNSSVIELSDYFSRTPEEIKNTLYMSSDLLAEKWRRGNINKKDNDSIISFYNNTQLEIFELIDWHARSFTTNPYLSSPLNYVCAMEIAKKLNLNTYLDYGSGAGSSAIVFLRNGFNVTCADIADPLLMFLKYRLRIRNLNANTIDLKKEQLPENTFDLITCFDVLEHAIRPAEIIRQLRKALKGDGILILNNVECEEDEERPLHISRVGLEKRLRSLGFIQLWDLQKDFKNNCPKYVVVLKKAERYFLINWLVYLYDNFCPNYLYKIIGKLKSHVNKHNNRNL